MIMAGTHFPIRNLIFLSTLSLLMCSCGNRETEQKRENLSLNAAVEILEHNDTGLTVKDTIPINRIGQSFNIDRARMKISEYWPFAEAICETDNENTKESHAVQVGWTDPGSDDNREKTEWIYQTDENGPAGVLSGLDLQFRVLPPGSEPTAPDRWKTQPLDTVHFSRNGHFHPVPEKGEEVFPGWILDSARVYEHALLDDTGEIHESDDTSFTNRALAITIRSTNEEDQTIERHLCFVDHPKLTRGIHPTILPVARLAGTGASQSRLTARDPITIPDAANHRILITSIPSDPTRFILHTWNRKTDAVNRVELDSLPAETKVDDTIIRIIDHRDHARSVTKWHRAASSPGKDTDEGNSNTGLKQEDPVVTQALVLTWIDVHHRKRIVLPLDTPTPARIKGEFKFLRYRNK